MENVVIWLQIYVMVLVFAFGACIGSFLNVCIWRIPREESIVHPRSRCPHCGVTIAWFDNIPLLSWLALRARCRHCGGRIAIRYFLVEMLTATLFLLIWLRYGADGRTPVYWLMTGGLILGTFVDLEFMIIPDRVTLGGMAAGLLLSLVVPGLHGETVVREGFARAVLGLVVGAGLLWLVARGGTWLFKKEAMGLGDVKLLGGLGAFLGWQAVLFITIVSSFVGAFVGISLVLAGRREWQSRIPYGPFIALAAIAWILGGSDLWHAYFAWLHRPPTPGLG